MDDVSMDDVSMDEASMHETSRDDVSRDDDPLRGRLVSPADAPVAGERVVALFEQPEVVIEQILSGALPQPLEFDQDHDEWVLVLEGHARLALDGRELELHAGDWLLIPAGHPHSVVETRPGTSWLAVHVRNRGGTA